MPTVAIAFETRGDAPSKGAFIAELLAIRTDPQGNEMARLHFVLHDESNPKKVTLEASMDALEGFVGSCPVVIHDGYNWKRFIRQELKGHPAERVKEFLALTVDVSDWAKRTYPKQRRDLNSLVKRLGLKIDSESTGLERAAISTAMLVPWVMQNQPAISPRIAIPLPSKSASRRVRIDGKPLPFKTRLRMAWQILRGSS